MSYLTIEEIADFFRTYVEERYPGVYPEEIRVPLSNGREIAMPLGAPYCAKRREPSSVPADFRAAVFAALDGSDEPLQADGLADAMNRPNNGRFRSYLSSMVKDGILAKTSDGYARSCP